MKDKDSDSFSYALMYQLICAVLITLFVLTRGFILPPFGPIWVNIILSTVLYAAFPVFLFKALKTTEASEVVVVLASGVLWTIVVALLFLGESLSLNIIIGTAVILSAIVFLSYKKGSFGFDRGHVYALVATACSGVAFANDTYILRQADAFSYTAISFTLVTVALLLFRPKTIFKFKPFLNLKTSSEMILMSAFYAIFTVAIYLAYQNGGTASQLGPILQSRVVVTVLLAALFLGEKDSLIKKIVSAILVSGGVLLIR